MRQTYLIWMVLFAAAALLLQTTCKTSEEKGLDVSVELVYIKGGSFMMGSPADESGVFLSDHEKQHKVTVNSFYMSKYQVTQEEWIAIMDKNPSLSQPRFSKGNLPVENVPWYDAVEYCNKRSIKEGLTPAYTIDKNQKDPNNKNNDDYIHWTVTWDSKANGYRLPTEAEWEYATRGGTSAPYMMYSGSNNPDEVAWYKDNSKFSSHKVGSKKPNGLGLYDMSGNVWEWCWDWYHPKYYSVSPSSNPTGPSGGAFRVIRGGDWNGDVLFVRSAYRSGSIPSGRIGNYNGFRVVRN